MIALKNSLTLFLNLILLQTTNVVAPRIIRPSSGNDVLLNELTNILESVERNQVSILPTFYEQLLRS